jgi:hypothetical protein
LAILRQDELSLGAILSRGLRTVNKHPKFIFDKLGIETRNAVVAAGYRNDIVCVMHGFPCSLVGMPWLMQPGFCLTYAAINRNIQNWPFGYEQGFPMGN